MDLRTKIENGFNRLTELILNNTKALDKRLRVDSIQPLSLSEQIQGRDNLDVYSKAEVDNKSLSIFTPIKWGNSWYTTNAYYDVIYPRHPVTNVINSAVTNGHMYLTPLRILENTTIKSLSIYCGTAQANATCLLGIYSANDTNIPSDLLFKSNTIDLSTTGIKTASCNVPVDIGQVLYLAIVCLTPTTGVALSSISTNSLNYVVGLNNPSSEVANMLYKLNMSDLPSICPSITPSYVARTPRIVFTV